MNSLSNLVGYSLPQLLRGELRPAQGGKGGEVRGLPLERFPIGDAELLGHLLQKAVAYLFAHAVVQRNGDGPRQTVATHLVMRRAIAVDPLVAKLDKPATQSSCANWHELGGRFEQRAGGLKNGRIDNAEVLLDHLEVHGKHKGLSIIVGGSLCDTGLVERNHLNTLLNGKPAVYLLFVWGEDKRIAPICNLAVDVDAGLLDQQVNGSLERVGERKTPCLKAVRGPSFAVSFDDSLAWDCEVLRHFGNSSTPFLPFVDVLATQRKHCGWRL